MAVSILVGSHATGPVTDITLSVDIPSISIEDTGNQADDTASFEVVDPGLVITALAPEGPVRIVDAGDDKFNGFVQHIEPAWEGIGRRFRVSCVGVSMLLDRCIIPATTSNAYRRAAGESDSTRIIWLLETFGQTFLDAGSSSFAKIQTLNADMEKQDFQGLTLRQAIERVLGAASDSANYFIDTAGRLHTWDDDNEEADTAPFLVNATPSLAADEVAPSDLRVDWDTSDLTNYYFVRAKSAAISGAVSNATSIAAYGRRQAFIDGPDADTDNKTQRLGRAALRDTKDPIVRANFTVETDYVTNGLGLTWAPGQLVDITSAAHGLSGYEIRVVRTTTTYLNGLGDKRVEIELGALRANFLGPDQWGTGTGKYPDPTVTWVTPLPIPVLAEPGGDGTIAVTASFDDGYATSYTHVQSVPDGVLGNDLGILVLRTDGAMLPGTPTGWTALDDLFIVQAGPNTAWRAWTRTMTGSETTISIPILADGDDGQTIAISYSHLIICRGVTDTTHRDFDDAGDVTWTWGGPAVLLHFGDASEWSPPLLSSSFYTSSDTVDTSPYTPSQAGLVVALEGTPAAPFAPAYGETVRETFIANGAESTFTTVAVIAWLTRVSVDGLVVPNAMVVDDTLTLDRSPADGAVVSVEYIAA